MGGRGGREREREREREVERGREGGQNGDKMSVERENVGKIA